jgi:hypothetical protein
LDTVAGQRDATVPTEFGLRPSDIIDASTELPRDDGPIVTAMGRRECGEPIDLACFKRLQVEIMSTAMNYEAQADVSVGTLLSIVRGMAKIAGRKTLVLISGGVVTMDRSGGRPDIGDLATEVGREAARANMAVYTINVDSSFQERNAAERGTLEKDLTNLSRDREVRTRWLQQFADAGGGGFLRVLNDSPEYAFKRVLQETSSYYLLGVEPVDADRSGRMQEIKVKVDQRNVTVRSRRWVALPQPGAAPQPLGAPAVPLSGAATVESSTSGAAAAESRRATPVIAAEVQPFAAAFGRGDYGGFHEQLGHTKDLANLIRALRSSDAPWPESPERGAVFALEIAVAGLRDDNGFARDQGARLLAEYNMRVSRTRVADQFECSWLWTETAALSGLLRPSITLPFVRRAVQRCPDEPRLRLADAVITEQRSLASARTDADSRSEVVTRYEAAMQFGETALEAHTRAAWFLYRTSNVDDAVGWLKRPAAASSDTYVRYLAALIRGQIMRAANRDEEAIASWREALTIVPRAQSARVALMTLLAGRGEREEAVALAAAVETAPEDDFDPWWNYWFGDFRAYSAIVAKLRELAR